MKLCEPDIATIKYIDDGKIHTMYYDYANDSYSYDDEIIPSNQWTKRAIGQKIPKLDSKCIIADTDEDDEFKFEAYGFTIDEFNEYVFESTSKIPIDDIEKASKAKEKEDKIASPYTKEEKEKSQGALAYKQSKQKKIKMTYMEKKEFEEIEDVIMDLETNLSQIEEKMNGVTNFKEIDELSKQRDDLQKQIDEKNERYLYLLELQEQIDNQ